MNESRETVRVFGSELEAHLARTLLEKHAIDSTVLRISRYRAMAGGGYGLRVPHDRLKEARRLLGELNNPVDMDEYIDADEPGHRRCPRCSSVNISAVPLPTKWFVMTFLSAGLLLFFLKRDWNCRKCGHHWRTR